MDGITPLGECKQLRGSLGSVKYKRLSRATTGYIEAYDNDMDMMLDKNGRGRKPRMIENKAAWYFKELYNNNNEIDIYHSKREMRIDINDCIVGICRLDHYGDKNNQRPLSFNVMVNLLMLDVITVKNIQEYMCSGSRQAQRYMRALVLVLPFIYRNLGIRG